MPAVDDKGGAGPRRPGSKGDTRGLPLTPAQLRLLTCPDDSANGLAARHWEQAVWDEFSLPRLRRAAEQVARRQPLVRAIVTGGDHQRFDAPLPESLVRITDGTALSATDQRKVLATECGRLCLTDNNRLGQAWQLHALLTGPDTAVITAGFARVFFDRPSIRALLDDLLDAYQQNGGESGQAALPLEDFRRWAEAAGDATDGPSSPAVATPPGPELPLMTSGTPGWPAPFARRSIRLDGATWSAVRASLAALAPDAGVEALVFAATGSVLALWSRTQQFSILVSRDGRTLQNGAAHAVGQFDHLLLAVADHAADASFATRVRAAQRGLDAARVAKATSAMSPGVAFAMTTPAGRGSPGVPTRSDQFVFIGASRPGVVLEVQAEETAEGTLSLHLDYVRERFPAGVVEDFAAALESWLRRLAPNHEAWKLAPAAQAWAIFPPDQKERRRAVNATRGPVSADCLFSGFMRQMAARRDQPAIITPTRTLTYGQLYGYAGRLALELVAHGVRRNELVAIAAEKGWEQIAAALGTILAGAAYLPVDLELPPDRVRFLIEHGEARVVVTQSSHADHLPLPAERVVIAMDALTPVDPSTPPPEVGVAPDDLAYVIFTSGSTGTPKGVMIDHRGAVNTIVDMNTRFQVRASDRVFALSRLSFDLSVYDIFGVLAAGGAHRRSGPGARA